MRVFRKIMALALALTLTLSMGAVSVFAAEGAGTSGVGSSSITISPTSLNLVVGGSQTLTATAIGVSGVITWSSDNADVATVVADPTDEKIATVTAVAVGNATITASVGGIKAICKVNVTEKGGDLTEYTVTFNSNGGSVVEAIKTKTGSITLPTAPTKKNYTFEGWFTDESTLLNAFDETNVTKSINVFAKWKFVLTTTVRFHSNGGTAVAPIKTTNGKITLPTPPTKEGYIFDGWFTDNGTFKFKFDGTTVSVDTDVHAKWKSTTVDTTALTEAIAAAKAKMKNVLTSINGTDVAKDKTWVTAEASKTLNAAVSVAQGKLNMVATTADAEAAAVVLKTATAAYVPKAGTKSSGGGGNTDTGGSSGGSTGGSTGGNNTANTPATSDKVNSTVDALKDPTAALPKDVVKTTTAGGATINTIPVAMTSGSATVGSSLFETLGSAPATVGLKLTVSNGMYGGSMEVIIPGGFGKITEPGRFSFPMDYSATAENSSKMLTAVKGETAVSMTAKVGGNFTLPVSATVTVPTKLANGSTVNIYKYDPLTNKMISIGKAVVKDGKLTFATKMMGEMLFTTGTV